MFLSCRTFAAITTLSTGLVGVEVTSTPTRPVDNVVIATKGLQDRNTNITAGTTVENKGKFPFTFYLILEDICSLNSIFASTFGSKLLERR